MSSSSTEVAEIRMPQMGVSVAEGTVVEWRKQPGDWVEADEVIAAISTDKIDTDVEAPAAGRLAEIVVAVGETVEVGTVLALIATDAKPGEAHTSEGTSEADVALEAPGDAGELPGDTDTRHARLRAAARERRRPGGRRYSPVVMRMAAEHDLDLVADRGHRPRRARAQAGRARLPRGRGGAPSRRCTSSRPTSRTTARRRASPAARGRRDARSRACASRSAARWSSRCRRRRRARRSSRRT